MNLDAMLRIKADVQGENNIRRLGNSMQGVQGKVKNLQMAFGGLSGAVKGFAAVLSIGAFTAFVKRGIDAADAMGKASARTGVAAAQLISFQNAAALADVSNEQLIKGLTKLNINMVGAAEGNDELNKRFQQLGITVKKEDGTLKETSQVFKELSDRFKDMPNGAQKAAAAMSIFGKSGVELITLLNGGSASLDEFTYKLSDEFAARSEYFNDSITKLGFKTQGFQMQLMDALLPALQSILDVFADLFATDNDWTALFEVIKGGLRIVASAIYATVALTGQLARVVVGTFQTVSTALKGDFSGAMDLFRGNVAGAIDQAKRDFANLGKIFTDAPAPGGGVGRRGFEMRDLGAEREADAAAKKSAADTNRLLEKRASLTQQNIDLQESLKRKLEDVYSAFQSVGATPVEKILYDQADAITENNRQVDDLTKQVVNLFREVQAAGGRLDVTPLEELINSISEANVALANEQLTQGLKDLLPSLDDYNSKIREIQNGKTVLTEVEKLNAQINLLQLDVLAATNPALAEHINLLRERAGVLDEANQKRKDQEASFGANFNEKIKTYYDSITNLGAQVGEAVTGAFQGMEDKLTEFVTTGKASFQDLANSIIADIARIAIRQAIIQPLVGALFPGMTKSAMGNVFAQNGIQKFARGGIVDKPTVFPFANGIGLMGEAGPEAIMPLRRGANGRLGVETTGGGGMNVTVNVDASGSQVQGNQPDANALGRAVGAAVQAELVKQKRPGGLLA